MPTFVGHVIMAVLGPQDVHHRHVVGRRRNVVGAQHLDCASVSAETDQTLEHLPTFQEHPDHGLGRPRVAQEVKQCLGSAHRPAVVVQGCLVTHLNRLVASYALARGAIQVWPLRRVLATLGVARTVSSREALACLESPRVGRVAGGGRHGQQGGWPRR